MPRIALRKDADQTLSFAVPEGTPTAATVVIYDSAGAVLVASSTATITASTLSKVIPAASLSTLATNLRAQWSYTVGTATYVRSSTFDVVLSPLYMTLTETLLTTRYATLLRDRFAPGSTSFTAEIALGWDEIHAALRAYGKDPNRVIDPAPLEPAHAYFTASAIATNYGPGGENDEWQAWARTMRAEGQRSFDQATSSIAWYDETQDLAPSSGETDARLNRTRITR